MILSASHPFRVMRNADLTIDEDEAADLLKEIQKQLKKRQWGEAIRLEVEDRVDKRSAEDSEKRAVHVHAARTFTRSTVRWI